jgi:uncharacterized protein
MSVSLPPHLASLLRAEAYPHAVTAVQLVETHISWVFLTGKFAYKVKKPVCYSFVDLRSPEQRAFFCAEELRLNRRFAPELYLEVCVVTLENGSARISGRGEVVDHAVRMRQFRAADELGALLARGKLAPRELADFGRQLAILHEQLPLPAAEQHWGLPQTVRALLLQNLAECLQAAEKLGAQEGVRSLSEAYGARLDAAEPWLTRRRETGKVRECHGDLHAGNIARYGDHLLAFDCIEFEPAFRWIDVAEDMACLFMDLCARHFAAHGEAFLGGYLFQSGDYQACRLLRLYATHRALVRAKVAALRAADAEQGGAGAASREEHCSYLACARRLLAADRPLLILICGMSGSGKSWLAEQLAPQLHAIHVRSDVERKRIAGLAEGQRSGAALEQGLYSAQMSDRTYEHLRQCAAEVLAGGFSVVVDATFQRRDQRASLGALAAECAATLQVVFCHAPREVLAARIAARERAGADASEADRSVLELQETRFEPIRAEENLPITDADTTNVDVASRVLEQLRQPTP